MYFRRRNYFIDKDFQLRYIGRIIFGIVVMALIVSFTVYYTTWARIMDAFYDVPQIALQFAPLFKSINSTLLLFLICFITISAIISVFLSHAIAGPVFRFRKTMEAIGSGDLSLHIGLRKNDEFKNLALTMNEMVGDLRDHISSDKALIEKMDEITKRIEGKKLDLPKGLTADLQALQNTLKQLRKNVARFKTGK